MDKQSGASTFVDASRAALLLRDQFPQHDIKVRAAAEQCSELF
jgi:hypothetical protein